jgi:hypothetical protein
MGEQPCHREYCPHCEREVAIVEGECPDCGREFECE